MSKPVGVGRKPPSGVTTTNRPKARAIGRPSRPVGPAGRHKTGKRASGSVKLTRTSGFSFSSAAQPVAAQRLSDLRAAAWTADNSHHPGRQPTAPGRPKRSLTARGASADSCRRWLAESERLFDRVRHTRTVGARFPVPASCGDVPGPPLPPKSTRHGIRPALHTRRTRYGRPTQPPTQAYQQTNPPQPSRPSTPLSKPTPQHPPI